MMGLGFSSIYHDRDEEDETSERFQPIDWLSHEHCNDVEYGVTWYKENGTEVTLFMEFADEYSQRTFINAFDEARYNKEFALRLLQKVKVRIIKVA